MKQRPTDIENKLMWRTGVDEIRNKIKLDNTRYHHVQREQGRQQPGCSNDAVFETEGGVRILVHPTPAHPFSSPYTSLVSATAITEDERREGLGKPRLVLCGGSHQHACAGRNQPLTRQAGQRHRVTLSKHFPPLLVLFWKSKGAVCSRPSLNTY